MKECRSGKKAYRTVHIATLAADSSAREKNRKGELCPNLYAYRCGTCHSYHLTRQPALGSSQNLLVHVAPPEDLQRWAMGRPR